MASTPLDKMSKKAEEAGNWVALHRAAMAALSAYGSYIYALEHPNNKPTVRDRLNCLDEAMSALRERLTSLDR